MNETPQKKLTSNVHGVLATSYTVYLAGFVVGVLVDQLFPASLLMKGAHMWGAFILFLGTAIIVWAQMTSKRTAHARNHPDTKHDVSHFHQGPYKIFRSPTHIGLALLLISYGFLSDSLPITLIAIAVFIITRITFVMKQEKMLEEKYGDTYKAYKKKVRI
jgi:protein-S-isoprenylcysteine O-methyltransferase Ste14